MTLLTISARRRQQTPADSTPYPMPTAEPWNAPTYAITPTPDGTGSAVHPSVVDMGLGGWRGFRYWMAVTPYYLSSSGRENPCILGSHDGYSWTVPSGVTNPIFGPPGSGDGYGYYSDTDLIWDPDSGMMVCYWRHVVGDGDEVIYASTSTTGSTWSAKAQQFKVLGSPDAALSPSVVRIAADEWAMFCVDYSEASITRRTAPSPLGPWGPPTACTPAIAGLWHIGVRSIDGALYALLNNRAPWSLSPAVSTDGGLTWAVGGQFMLPITGSWDDQIIYRAQLQPHEDGAHVRVWYSADSNSVSWRVGYTRIPRSAWTSLLP